MLPHATWLSSVTTCIALSVFSLQYLPDAAMAAAAPHYCRTSHWFMCDITKCGAACVSVASAPPHNVTPV